MTINLNIPDIRELKPRITVFGVGGAGGNAVNNMITAGLQGVDFVVANTDAQALTMSKAERVIQMGAQVTEGLGAGSQPEVGRTAAEEAIDEIRDHLSGAHMVFVTAGMGGGTGTGAAPVIAKAARDIGILTVGVVTKPFHFEGQRRMRIADGGITELQKCVDTLLIIPNQNLFRVANEKTTFADAFALADQVLYSGVACITDLMVKEGLINLDFADVRAVMREMGKAMMGTGEAEGDKRALTAAEAAISNPLIDDASMKGARGLLISITGGRDLTLYEVDEAATRIREEVDQDANIIVGATFDESLDGMIRVSVVATGIDQAMSQRPTLPALEPRMTDVVQRIRTENQRSVERSEMPRPAAAAPMTPAVPAAVATLGPAMSATATVHASIETAAKAAIAAAVEDVSIRPLAPKPSLFLDPTPQSESKPQKPEMPEPAAFIPPQPERGPVRAPRMPRLDELPVPAQNELRARRGETRDDDHPEKRRRSLLQRLASVGLGRRDQDDHQESGLPAAPVSAAMGGPVSPERLVGRPMQRAAEPRQELRQELMRHESRQDSSRQDLSRQDSPRQDLPISEYARRPAPQGLDQHGRQSPVHNSSDEDQLDIPAFLRRQAK
ncbi:MAG: cell division protein FtsZ [Xanthobacteraceae bacterium]